MKLSKTLIAAAAVLASVAAHAGVAKLETGNSSLIFLAQDTSDTTSIVVDLGLNFSDLAPGSALNQPGTTITWNFLTGAVTGATVSGDWAAAYNTFATAAGASASKVQFGVIAGDISYNAGFQQYLTTGNATAAQVAGQTYGGIGNLGIVDNTTISPQIDGAGIGTLVSSENGAGAVTSSGSTAYLPNIFGGNWTTNLNWSAFADEGTANAFRYLNDDGDGNIVLQPGVFNYSAGVLTYTVAGTIPVVPEPGTYALMIAGLAGMAFAARRRAAR